MRKYIKLGVVLLMVSAVLFLGGRSYSLENENKAMEMNLVEAKGEYPDIYNYLGSVTYPKFQHMVEEKQEFYVYVGRPTCGDCNDFEPELIDLIEKHQLADDILYLNVAALRKEEDQWELFKETYDVQYTPTLAKFSGGKLVNKVEWTPENGINIDDVEKYIVENINE